jgi:hypothetical protein
VLCAPTQAALANAVDGGELAYFELAARACLAEVDALACEVGWSYDLLALRACREMLEPQAAAGQACGTVLSCVEGAVCAVGDACPGRCIATVAVNLPCDLGAPCAPGLYCGLTQRRCLPSSARGRPCEPSLTGNPCQEGSWCDASQPASPVCRAGKGRGEGCRSRVECAGGAACIRNRCSAGQAGDACTDDLDCADGRRCAANRCAEAIALDAECSALGAPCDEGLTCTATQGASRCRPQPRASEACDEEHPCFWGRCAAGLCVPALEDGAACAEAQDCLPGRACREGRCALTPRDCRR